MVLSKLSRKAFIDITLVCRTAEDVMSFHGLSHCGVDVGDDFTVGLYGCWRGTYWVLELRTGIIYYAGSLAAVRAWIKLCREDANEGV